MCIYYIYTHTNTRINAHACIHTYAPAVSKQTQKLDGPLPGSFRKAVNDLTQQQIYGCRPFAGTGPTWTLRLLFGFVHIQDDPTDWSTLSRSLDCWIRLDTMQMQAGTLQSGKKLRSA